MQLNTHNRMFMLTRKKLGVIDHWGVQLPNGLVAHCLPRIGVCVTTPEEFAQGEEVSTLGEIPMNLYGQIMQKLQQACANQRPYVIGEWNCEIFAKWLVGEKAENSQVKVWTIVALGLVALGVAARMG